MEFQEISQSHFDIHDRFSRLDEKGLWILEEIEYHSILNFWFGLLPFFGVLPFHILSSIWRMVIPYLQPAFPTPGAAKYFPAAVFWIYPNWWCPAGVLVDFWWFGGASTSSQICYSEAATCSWKLIRDTSLGVGGFAGDPVAGVEKIENPMVMFQKKSSWRCH